MVFGAAAFFVFWAAYSRFGQHHSWSVSIVGGIIAAPLWTLFMALSDTYRRRRGKTPLYPDGRFRDNMRTGWAVARYSPLQWAGFALVFGLFSALAVVALANGSIGEGLVGLIPFAALTAVSLVQAVRARG